MATELNSEIDLRFIYLQIFPSRFKYPQCQSHILFYMILLISTYRPWRQFCLTFDGSQPQWSISSNSRRWLTVAENKAILTPWSISRYVKTNLLYNCSKFRHNPVKRLKSKNCLETKKMSWISKRSILTRKVKTISVNLRRWAKPVHNSGTKIRAGIYQIRSHSEVFPSSGRWSMKLIWARLMLLRIKTIFCFYR